MTKTALPKTLSVLLGLALLCVAGCDNRKVSSNADAGPGAGERHDSSGPVPDSIYVADGWGPKADAATPQPCPPSAEYKVQAKLYEGKNGWVAQIRNVGCKTVYRMVGCCGEGEPHIEVPNDKGKFIQAQCSYFEGPCCDAEPQCVGLAPGQMVEVPVSALKQRRCCGKTFRAAFFFSRNPGCVDNAMLPPVMAHSNSVTLSSPDPCDGDTTCGALKCDGAKEICVRNEAWQTEYKCVPVPAACTLDRSCKCLGKQVCTGAFDVCGDVNTSNTVSCSCPNC